MKPNPLDQPLVVGCSEGITPSSLILSQEAYYFARLPPSDQAPLFDDPETERQTSLMNL